MRLVLDEVEHHNSTMLATIKCALRAASDFACQALCRHLMACFDGNDAACSDVHKREAEGTSAEEDGAPPAVDWSKYPEEASAIIVHHDSILRNKRVLWTYM